MLTKRNQTKMLHKQKSYSRVPNNRRGWNNRGGLDIVIIINNRGVGIIGGLDEVKKIV